MRLARHYGWLVGGLLLLAIGARIWWVAPEELQPGPLLSSARLQSGNYRLVPKPGIETTALVNAILFEGYRPDRHSDFEDTLKAQRSRYVRRDSSHHYVEYLGTFGRIQLHEALDQASRDSGLDQWFVFFPTDLAVDAFFAPDMAILLAPELPKYTVYIPNAREQSYMTVWVAERRVQKVSWSKWYGKPRDSSHRHLTARFPGSSRRRSGPMTVRL